MKVVGSRARLCLAVPVLVAASSFGCGADIVGQLGPASMSAVSGTTPQTAIASTAVATPPAVRVADANGNAMAGVTVVFGVLSGGGAIEGASPKSNANGIAAVEKWTLGGATGSNTLVATIPNLSPVTFTATGVVGAPTQLTKASTDPQTATAGSSVAVAPSVIVKDASGNPVPGQVVTFTVTSGSGSIAGGTVISSSSGLATSGSWMLGTTAGANSLSASAVGIAGVTFAANGTAGSAALITASPAQIELGLGATQQLTTTVADQYNNVIANATLTFSSAATGVATVSSTGLVTAVTGGTTTVTIASGGATAKVAISVGGHPQGIWSNSIAGIAGWPFGLRVSVANRLGVTQLDLSAITLLDVSGTGPRVVVPVGVGPIDVVFNRAGTTAYVSGYTDGTVRFVDVASGAVSGGGNVATSANRLVLSPDDSRLIVSASSGRIVAVNVSTSAVVATTTLLGSVQGLAFSPDGQALYATTSAGRVARLVAGTLVLSANNDLTGNPQDVAVTSDGKEVFVANELGWVDVLDATTLVLKQRIITAAFAPFGLAISPDDAQIYVTSSITGQLMVIDCATRAIIRTLTLTGKPRRVVFTPTGFKAVVANEGGWVDIIR